MKEFIKNISLSLVFFLLFLFSLVGQIIFALEEHNIELLEEGGASLSQASDLSSGHFLQSTFKTGKVNASRYSLSLFFPSF